MKTQQPTWEPVANLGDANPIDNGGFFVLRDTTGVYPPEAVSLEPSGRGWIAYRITLDPVTLTDGVLSDNRFHPLHPVWWSDRLQSIASTVGRTPADLTADFLSSDPLQRAEAYRALLYSFGGGEFDSDHLWFEDRAEVEAYVEQLGF